MPYAEAAPIVTVPLFVISIPVYEGLELLIAASLSPLVIDPGESMTKHLLFEPKLNRRLDAVDIVVVEEQAFAS
jgi:hypothetical protein